MTTIALFGAGGKMGYRLSTNFRGSPYTIRHVEVSEAGRERLKSGLGFDAVSADEALEGADVVILAVPDTHIGKVAASIESKLAVRHDGGRARRRRTVRRPFAEAAGPDLFRHPSLPSADLQRRDRHGGQEGLFRRRQGQAAYRQRADAGAGRGLRQGRGDRQDHLGAGHALAPRHGRADGAARARPFGNRVRLAARRHERSRRRSAWRAASTSRPRSTSCSAT